MASATLSGVKYMDTVAPGEIVNFSMTLSLPASDPATDYQFTVLGFGNDPNGNYVGIDPMKDTSPYSARPYITLDKSLAFVPSGGSDTVTATIKVPEGDGGRYALINIHPIAANGTGSSIVVAMNVPIMVTIKNSSISETGAIERITVFPNSTTTVFTNTGNHHVYGAVNKLEITNPAGNTVTTVSEPMVTAIVPGGKVNFTQITIVNPGDSVVSTIYTGDETLATQTLKVPGESTTPTTLPATTKSPLGIEVVALSIIGALALFHKRS